MRGINYQYQRYLLCGLATLLIFQIFISLTGVLGDGAAQWPTNWAQHAWDWKDGLEQGEVILQADGHKQTPFIGQAATLHEGLPADKHYLFSMYRGGWTNQVMCMISSLHLAVLANRIPLLDAFIAEPVHMPGNPHHLLASEVFDLPRLASALGIDDVVEVETFKAPINDQAPAIAPIPEALGCWSYFEGGYRGVKEPYPYVYALNAEMTPLPEEVMVRAPLVVRINSHKLAALMEPGRPYIQPQSSMESIKSFSLPVPKVDPEDRIACVDNLFSATTTDSYSWDEIEYNTAGGSWDVVGRHLRFTPETYARGQAALRQALELGEDERIPPFIAIHLRRDDFPGKVNFQIQDYAHAAALMDSTLRSSRGVTAAERILIFTDEPDMEYRANVTKQYPRLHFLDHKVLKTEEKYGVWYPIVLDSVMISMSSGFIGTAGSTMTILSCRRMTSWNTGTCSILTADKLAPEGWTWGL